MKRRIQILSTILALLLGTMLNSFVLAICCEAKESETPTKTINVVYDDSGSMYENTDTWCKAKYSMEVFGAMLEQQDTMNIYVMSDFQDSNNAGPYLSLSGADDAQSNVSKIHDMLTNVGSTPFGSVRKAMDDLVQTPADEKWLLVLTDGAFSDVDNIDAYFAQKSAEIKLMFLSIGTNASTITADEKNNIFCESAKDSNEILNKITNISTRVFNRNKLEVDTSSKKFEFDIPMQELIIFAQGSHVKMHGVKPDGEDLHKATKEIPVKFCEIPALNVEQAQVDENLKGTLSTFTEDFDAGKYTLEVEGAETLEIYYKPNVEVRASLVDEAGNILADVDGIKSGEYKLEFALVDAKEKKEIGDSKLLGDVKYSATVTNGGSTFEVAEGDSFKAEDGDLDIEARVKYLDYNSVSTSKAYKVYSNKLVDFEVVDNPKYQLTPNGFENGKEPIVVNVSVENVELDQDKWKAMELPVVEAKNGKIYKMGKYKVKKGKEIGQFLIYPTLNKGNAHLTNYENTEFTISYEKEHDNEVWSGRKVVPVQIEDKFSFIERNGPKMIPWLILLLIIIFIIFWMTRLVLPREIIEKRGSTSFKLRGRQIGQNAKVIYDKRNNFLSVSTRATTKAEHAGNIALTIKPIDKRYVKSKKRRIEITEIRQVGNNVKSFEIAGVRYLKNRDGKWTSGNDEGGIHQNVKNADVTIVMDRAMLACTLEHK